MKYILLALFVNGGGVSAEFNNKKACLEAAFLVASMPGHSFVCVEKGEDQLTAAAREARGNMFEFIEGITDGD